MRRWLIVVCLAGTAWSGSAALSPNRPVPVRILYDNSGSMYPGYRPPGTPDRRSRAELGVGYFHQDPAFPQWLGDFVQRQSLIDGGSVGMWTFTSGQNFTPADIRQVHPVVPLREFDTAAAIANFPQETGDRTYLTETIDAFTRDFTGLIWLITDNIVETNAGEPDEGVRRFFETLARRDDIRSVHLFKYVVGERGQTGALAVYGLLVSAADVPIETLAYYDERFRMLRDAKRRESTPAADLFPGREHLKLKNLSVDPIHLRADLQLLLADRDKGMFQEGRPVELELEGEIRSNLTQHSVTAGRYELAIASPFVPEEWAQRDLGAQSLESNVFESVNGEIRQAIPPKASQRVQALIHSTQPVSFTPSGIGEWLRLAWNGAAVRYTGQVRMSFNDVNVRLERQQMAGIFGIDQASSIFEFQNVTRLPQIRPSVVPVSFALRTGSSRTATLLGILAVLAALIAATLALLARKRAFEIAISNGPNSTVALRRLGTHRVVFEQKVLGRLSRPLLSGFDFIPVRGDGGVTVVPASGDTWSVKFAAGGMHTLSIKEQGGGPPSPRSARGVSPPRNPSRSAPSAPPTAPGRPRRIGRS